jgi:lysophospholipid acyltransferase
LLFLLNF